MAPGQNSSEGTAPEVQRQVLGRAARHLASSADFRDSLRQTIGACLPALGDFGFFDVVYAGGVARAVAAHDAPDIEALLAPTQWVRQVRQDMNLCALSSGEAALHPETDDRWYRNVAGNEGHLTLLRALAFRSMITVPVRYRDELVGALTLFMGRSGRRHTAQDMDFASELALLAAPVVINARLLEQHRQAEAALRTSEERLRLAVDAGELGIWDWDIRNDHVSWTERVFELHGVSPLGFGGTVADFRKLIHPDDLDRVGRCIADALAGRADYRTEFRVPLPDGRTRWLYTRAHVVRDEAGEPVRMVGSTNDVTPRIELLAAERQAREQSEAARRRFELLASAGAVLATSLDPDETLRAIASTIVPGIADWCRIDLLDDRGALQRRLAHHCDPARASQALDMAREMRAAPGTIGSMGWVIANGRSHYGHFDDLQEVSDPVLRLYTQTFGMGAHYIIPLVARRRTIGAMAVIQAESGRELSEDDRALILELGQRAAMAIDNARLYAEAEAARRQAETANRTKDEFLAMLGHELRNPLAPIATALELMARRDPGAGVEERRVIGRQVAHLSRLIDDLLDVSRITQGKIQLRQEPVDLKLVVANAIELTRPVFEKHSFPVDVRIGPGPAMVCGDAVRLTQVLCNLLVNAAKFTPPQGTVKLFLGESQGWQELVVEDSGAGIDAQLLPHVFDLFVQGQQSIDRHSGGLGLGLPIVRNLVELHGGEVIAASEGAGCGSRFTVRLPSSGSAWAPTGLPVPDTPPAPQGGRVLVVDDNADAAETVAELLRMGGYEVQSAGHGKAAMALLETFAPQLALLDIGLPGIDGYQLAAMMRRHPKGAGIRLVALTGYGSGNDRARAMEAGFDEHLVKPVLADRLFQALSGFDAGASG